MSIDKYRVQSVYDESVVELQAAGVNNCRLEVNLLFEKLKNWTPQDIIVNEKKELEDSEFRLLNSWLKRRKLGEPMAYILGYRYFYKNKFFVNPSVLIPRPETELVVEKVLTWASERKEEPLRIMDFGAGTGCIGLSLIDELSKAELVLVEFSPEAISVAKENALQLGLEKRCTFIEAKVQDLDVSKWSEADIVVANPPYICEKNGFVEENVRVHEPKLALFSEAEGLKDIEEWSKVAIQILKKQNSLYVMEFGDNQNEQVLSLVTALEFFDTVQSFCDYANLPRYFVGEKN